MRLDLLVTGKNERQYRFPKKAIKHDWKSVIYSFMRMEKPNDTYPKEQEVEFPQSLPNCTYLIKHISFLESLFHMYKR